MSKFRLSADELIQKIEVPIMSSDLHSLLRPLKDLRQMNNLRSRKILFNADYTHIDDILIRHNCCLLTMYARDAVVGSIDTPIKLWNKWPTFQNLYVFHYEQDLERDTFVIRPVLSAILEDDLSIILGDPIVNGKWKIIKGIYP